MKVQYRFELKQNQISESELAGSKPQWQWFTLMRVSSVITKTMLPNQANKKQSKIVRKTTTINVNVKTGTDKTPVVITIRN